MKRFIYSIGVLAVAALTAISCHKEIAPENESGKMVTVTFVADAATTKSAAIESADGVTYKWTNGDASNMKLFTVNGSSLTEVEPISVDIVSETKLTITASVPANSTVRAIMAKEWDGTNPIVLSSQSPGTDNFDPNADILISEDERVNGSMPEEGLFFDRQVVINKMTLHNLAANEKVNQVVITSTKELTGAGNTLTLNYTNATADADGIFPVYFVSKPNKDQRLTVEVHTDQFVYTKELTADVSLNLGQFTRFGVALPAGTPPETLNYVKVTSADGLIDGKYLIVYEEGSLAFNGGLETLDASNNTISVVVNDNKIKSNEVTDAAAFTISVDDGTILSKRGLYIGVSSNSNGLNTTTDATTYTNSFEIDSDGNAVISAVFDNSKMTLQCYSASGNARFRYYQSKQKPVALYRLEGSDASDPRTDVMLSFAPENPEMISFEDKNSFIEPTLVVTPAEAASAVVYSVYSVPTNSASINESTGKLTITHTGKITVTATIPSGNVTYKPASASYELIVDGFVTLDWVYPTEGAATKEGISSIPGVIASGLGSDYDNHSPYCIRFDDTGDYIQIKTDVAIGEVSVMYKMIGGATTSTLNVFESSDGENFTLLQDLAISGTQNSTGVLTTTEAFASESRYVKISFTKGSNVGIGGITINKVDTTPSFTVQGTLDANADGGSFTVGLTRKNFTGAITVSTPSGCDWITPGTIAANATSFNVQVSANTGSSRTATLTLSADGVESQLLVVNQAGASTGGYTLNPVAGSNNSYAGNCDVTIDGITWNVTGNAQTIPWRIGGKSITAVDRAIYSKTSLGFDVSKIVITHGNASSITVNSMTVIVASDANFTNEVSRLTRTFLANDVVTIERPNGKNWSNCYYKIVYNVTVSGNSNKFLEFTKAEFTSN